MISFRYVQKQFVLLPVYITFILNQLLNCNLSIKKNRKKIYIYITRRRVRRKRRNNSHPQLIDNRN